MQAVPSLVGTGTAAAAAAVGLVFGQPPESEPQWSSPIQSRFPAEYDSFRLQAAPRRPSTSATPNYYPGPSSPVEDFPYASFRQLTDAAPPPLLTSYPTSPTSVPRPLTGVSVTSPKSTGRRYSFIRSDSLATQPIAENARDSVSSRDSWIRRLSLRPLSQHGSRRSSMGPDSSSMTFSNGSGVPMLGQSPTLHTSPNKLVKRATSGQNGAPGNTTGRGSKSQVLTLRRPATSHQRSATMQQFQQQGPFLEPLSPDVTVSFDNYNPSPTSPMFPPAADHGRSGKWTSFFHSRRSTSSPRDIPGLPPGSGAYHNIFPKRRMSLAPGHVCRAYLTKSSEIAEVPVIVDEVDTTPDRFAIAEQRESSQFASDGTDSTDSTPDKPPRRSISMHFSSAGQWIARTGSMRRPRRNTVGTKTGDGRYTPDPGAAPRDQAQPPVKLAPEGVNAPLDGRLQPHQHREPDLKQPADLPRTRKRNSSSPLPPLNRLSTFSLDVARIGTPTSSTGAPSRPLHTPINYSQPPSTTTHSRGPSGERSVTLAGSDVSARDGVFGDDEDTDFRSDGMYDSFRTRASSSRGMRSVETPAESMFDESPPSTASNGRTKRLSIQEMLGRSWDGETKITEEDEGIPTPIRPAHLSDTPNFAHQDRKADEFGFDATHELQLADRDFGRLSFDDDDDDDWARDDDNTLSNHLSPPSSTNSRRVSPTLRLALRSINGNGNADCSRDSMSDRPRSNIFDWSEPSIHDKFETDLPRPKTVHGKQELDLRGGRSTTRKPPGAAHIRSQSVPLVPDLLDGSKPPPKFGTWGLGTNPVSEDWDDDFEFESDEPAICSPDGKDSATSFSMVVPASIAATQPSVRAHSGQIRELSLLVNDLKRLCRHGKDLDIIRGPISTKWAEAEGIIALASPDEEEEEELGSSKPSMDFDRSKIDERFLEEGFDGPLLDHVDDPFGFPEPEMSKTAVVRERHSPRRRSVFSPEDDIFGNWPLVEGSATPARPRTPSRCSSPSRNSTIISTVIEAMKQQQKSTSTRVKSPPSTKTTTTADTKLFFDTNSLQELVKRAGQLRDSLSDAVRRAELLTQSPAGTPRRATDRHSRHLNPDGSPAFTKVFVDPAASPPRRLLNSHSTPSILSRTSVDSPRMQMMTVS
ncbi:hypothetical protein C8A05DRAFT_33057 [Staphylotrichum tortipilum]|uniref:Uncharacterized protein n=1 Tax=Staphylotrichum tortipilum TaxID=2831512 RepID=A0AAN6MLN3_9PEZI|nr:hypothetical protein C8A05DRAFT_33057 [Staphylotrichum longicolle]